MGWEAQWLRAVAASAKDMGSTSHPHTVVQNNLQLQYQRSLTSAGSKHTNGEYTHL